MGIVRRLTNTGLILCSIEWPCFLGSNPVPKRRKRNVIGLLAMPLSYSINGSLGPRGLAEIRTHHSMSKDQSPKTGAALFACSALGPLISIAISATLRHFVNRHFVN